MRRVHIAIAAIIALCPLTAAAKEVLPGNVTTRGNRVVDKIDWSFVPSKPVDFARVKRCVATNLTNDEIRLNDAAGSFVGPATGNYYRSNNQSTVAGRDVFKFVDEKNSVLVAQGWIDKPVFAFRWIIRFDLEIAIEPSTIKMVMRNIKLAMSNTGSSANEGFGDLLTSYRFKQNYATLEQAATAVKSCIVE